MCGTFDAVNVHYHVMDHKLARDEALQIDDESLLLIYLTESLINVPRKVYTIFKDPAGHMEALDRLSRVLKYNDPFDIKILAYLEQFMLLIFSTESNSKEKLIQCL